MPENAENVLCRKSTGDRLSRSHSVNLPILKYIKEIELLQENLFKAKSPTKVPVRCRLTIVPKSRRGVKPSERKPPEIPFDTIVISQPIRAQKSAEKLVTESIGDVAKKSEPEAKKHIHPCVCDFTAKQRERIENHVRERAEEQFRFETRVNQIEEQIRMVEEEAEERRREKERDRELWAEHYVTDEKGRKHKKKSVRRVSMVSLGVRQFIDWKKSPKLTVRYNRVFELRKANRTYCKPATPAPVPKDVPVWDDVGFSATKASQLRCEYNRKWIDKFNEEEQKKGKYPNRPEFLINYGKLWYKY